MEAIAKLTLLPEQQCVIARQSLREKDAKCQRTITHHCVMHSPVLTAGESLPNAIKT